MTEVETGKIMAVLRGAYPNFYRDMSRDDALQTVSLWTEMFADEPYEIVAAAVKTLIATDSKGFPPHIGAVKEKLRIITEPKQMTEAEAWGIVAKAVGRSLYGAEKEYAELPENIKRLVGSSMQLKEWAMMDSETFHSVVASNFQRSYKVRAKQDADYMALPKEVKLMLESVSQKFALEESHEPGA